MIARLTHYAVDAVFVSTILAGLKRTSGFTPNLGAIPDDTARGLAQKYLGVGEWIFDVAQATAVNSQYFVRGEK
ncbi:hypothetical protein K488DRAFT_84189 [Vararia minispora EC-137]|uniref:Uncharacterized protein n=1 Tax=Vararia minispora EC-137 TaxID=1314806 RepID=A0ACB8QRP0_9AGAM|nr:hypothetical protein K488DRAFT_84189 [Vararia minispora EC-137]